MKSFSHKPLLWLLTCLLLIACQFLPTAATQLPAATQPAALPASTEAPRPAAVTQAPAIAVEPVATALPAPTQVVLPPVDNGKIAYEHLSYLSGQLGPRRPGSKAETAAAEYIRDVFEGIGYATETQPFAFEDEDGDSLGSQNIIAVKPGISNQVIIVGAHYDSGSEAAGADDNASGVAVMLEAAEAVYSRQTPYTLVFIAFGAEENDLDGSYAYVEQMSRNEIEDTVAMVNLDSLVAGDLAYIYGDDGPGTLLDWTMELASDSGFLLDFRAADELDNPDGSRCECADYDPFQLEEIPFIYFEATNWELGEQDGMTQVDPSLGENGEIRHTRYDTIDTINRLFPGRIEHHLNLFTTLLIDILTEYQS